MNCLSVTNALKKRSSEGESKIPNSQAMRKMGNIDIATVDLIMDGSDSINATSVVESRVQNVKMRNDTEIYR